MHRAKIAGIAALLLVSLGPAASLAHPQGAGPAARLSAALGGVLDSDVGEAGSLAHPIDYSSIELIPGRSVEYRRRVALEKSAAERLTVARR